MRRTSKLVVLTETEPGCRFAIPADDILLVYEFMAGARLEAKGDRYTVTESFDDVVRLVNEARGEYDLSE